MTKQDADAAQVNEADVVVDPVLSAGDDPSEVVEPGHLALHLPAAAASPQRSAVLRLAAVEQLTAVRPGSASAVLAPR
jgi:hypothetical protein